MAEEANRLVNEEQQQYYIMAEPNRGTCCDRWFNCYLIWNIIRYISIGAIILAANILNRVEIQGYNKYCCSCYYISRDPIKYSIPDDAKFDLSNCIPTCTDCNHCEAYFNHSAQAAFNYINLNDNQCPLPQYHKRRNNFLRFDWNEVTGCDNSIHIKSLYIFSTYYIGYGIVAFIISAIYCYALIRLRRLQKIIFPIVPDEILQMIALYNVVVSEICLYFLFVPYQYYHKTLHVGDHNDKVICEIDSLNMSDEVWFAPFVWIGFAVPVVHVICAVCCRPKDDGKYEQRAVAHYRLDSDQIEEQDALIQKFMNKRWWKWAVFVAFTAIYCSLYLAILIYAVSKMYQIANIKGGYKGSRNYIITIAFILLIESLDMLLYLIYQLYGHCRTCDNNISVNNNDTNVDNTNEVNNQTQ